MPTFSREICKNTLGGNANAAKKFSFFKNFTKINNLAIYSILLIFELKTILIWPLYHGRVQTDVFSSCELWSLIILPLPLRGHM